ncbi:RNA polymerase Rpb3/RpoA insert domain [Carpediemonas membranifera]|uniref:DNA-directed RNA polymerases I and III subunit RPAC1 n=1 Tax=Carpediemonas membranifera TaxID=201153 RepID=A0A8J6APT4_9EUKA|nr:RNA polymerase Rpb3/RpoA insert domain [Carpediemonas membranifera]|eukprot:KAG9389923.1 RNA polymerase Rpb3/RpoA insert domain [Carpediemonas membranifera]
MERADPDQFAQVSKYGISNTATTSGTAFSLSTPENQVSEQLSVKILSKHENELEFELINADPSIANALRRIMISEVPTVAIEKAVIKNNTSIMQDEVLAHRIGLVPLRLDPSQFEYFATDGSESGTELNTIVFTLKVDCKMENGVLTPDNGIVYSRDLVWHRDESHQYNDRLTHDEAGNELPLPGPVHGDIPIMKLCQGQSLDLELHCVKGVGRDHAKFSPVGTAVYRLQNDIRLSKEMLGEEKINVKKLSGAEKVQVKTMNKLRHDLVTRCPLSLNPGTSTGSDTSSVFKLIETKSMLDGDKLYKVKLNNPSSCTMCRECIQDDELATHVQLLKVKGDYLFKVESIGSMEPEDIVRKALAVLKDKCAKVRQTIEDNTEKKGGAAGEEVDDEEM